MLSKECAGSLDFEPSHPCPRKDIAAVPFRDRDLRESKDAARKVLSDVPLDPASARDWANEPAGFKRVMHAVMDMKKLDLTALQRAFDGE